MSMYTVKVYPNTFVVMWKGKYISGPHHELDRKVILEYVNRALGVLAKRN